MTTPKIRDPDFTLQVKEINFCLSKYRTPFGQWWVPEGKTAVECTYCEYCVKNGCHGDTPLSPLHHRFFNITGTYQDEIPKSKESTLCNCNCDCKEEHPLLYNLRCPICYILMMRGWCGLDCFGNCTQCGNLTSHGGMVYCIPCSYIMESCGECGQPFRSGDEYITEIIIAIDKYIDEIQKNTPLKIFYERELSRLKQLKANIEDICGSKSRNEILEMARKSYQSI